MPTSQTDARAEAREAVEVAVAKSVWDALMQIDGWAAFWVADQKVMRHKGVQDALDALVLEELRALPCGCSWVLSYRCPRCKRIAELEVG
jgi:hypothetical protein